MMIITTGKGKLNYRFVSEFRFLLFLSKVRMNFYFSIDKLKYTRKKTIIHKEMMTYFTSNKSKIATVIENEYIYNSGNNFTKQIK